MADFSNYGNWVDVYAPGVNVYSTYLQADWLLPNDTPPPRQMDGWAIWSGTSFAAPQVAAAIANTLLAVGRDRAPGGAHGAQPGAVAARDRGAVASPG